MTGGFSQDQPMTDISRRLMLAGVSIFGATAQVGKILGADASVTGGKRVALDGYDPVSYFTAGSPEKGSDAFIATYDDATYWFKSDEHRALFVADPDRYAPQFNGFCAINISRGKKYEADPEAWVIADGKLYVFAAKEGVPIFRQQTASIVQKAVEHWPELRKEP
jgi:YHS domain-containing protein